jgi:hypothetical protein
MTCRDAERREGQGRETDAAELRAGEHDSPGPPSIARLYSIAAAQVTVGDQRKGGMAAKPRSRSVRLAM